MDTKTRKLTYDDYVCYPDDGKRHEIIDGLHFMNPAPSTYHQLVSRRLQFQLYSAIELAGLGYVMNAPVDVQLSDHDIVQPDLVVVLSQNPIITDAKLIGPPEHVIEILSPSTRTNDTTRKRKLYERSGVPEYWILDPDRQQVTRLLLQEGEYQQSDSESHVIPVSYLPDVAADFSEIW